MIQVGKRFLPKQTYPNRTGVHGNTTFGLSFALDYARTTQNIAFEKELISATRRLYVKDKSAPTIWEPDGSDFFSPSLMEADLMRKVLDKPGFISWFNNWLSAKSLQHLTALPKVSDRTDLQIVRLAKQSCPPIFAPKWVRSHIFMAQEKIPYALCKFLPGKA